LHKSRSSSQLSNLFNIVPSRPLIRPDWWPQAFAPTRQKLTLRLGSLKIGNMSGASPVEPGIAELLTVAQAIRIIDQSPVEPRMQRRPLLESAGFRLAEDLRTDRDYPPFRKSLMDGYAVRCQDILKTPAELQCVGEIAAGQSAKAPLEAGQAMAIMTGAPLPDGADGVVPVEDVERRAAPGEAIRVLRAPSPNRYIAQRGSDGAVGKVVLRRGTILGPAQIGVAASIGAASVNVFLPPRVAVLGTGSELAPIDGPVENTQIRNSNTPMLAALLRRLGCDVTDLGFVRDEPPVIRDAILRGLEFDAIFIAGGMSMGEYDFVPLILKDLGVTTKITKLRIKPGKPFLFGSKERVAGKDAAPAATNQSPANTASSENSGSSDSAKLCYVFGLPGNPVSAFVCTLRLASRLLTRIGGGMVEERWLTGRLDGGLTVNGPREFYQPAIRTVAPGAYSSRSEFAMITPLDWKGSADLFTLAKANVILVRAENEPPIPKGSVVRALEI